jgi:DNA excision repair protein ERCC-3
MSVLTLQTDRTVLLDAEHPDAEAAHFSIAPFAELFKTPGPLHTYRLTPLSLWNAAAAGWSVQDVLTALESYSTHLVPESVRSFIEAHVGAFGRIWIDADDHGTALHAADSTLLDRLARQPKTRGLLGERRDARTWAFAPEQRAALKLALLHQNQPVDDRTAFHNGATLKISLDTGQVILRDYQREAIERMVSGGSGVVVLPCGAGKTLVGIGLMSELQVSTLILTPSIVAARQWTREIACRTTLDESQIGEYSGERKQVRPVTTATYQMLTQLAESVDTATGEIIRKPNLSIFGMADWGLIIYDEVHLLPAPVFRLTAGIQATRRLGLTATLVREDGREGDVFALIGPTRYQAAWKTLERAGWIAEAQCAEVRIAMEPDERLAYVQARPAVQARLASENAGKPPAVAELVKRHAGEQVLVIGQYLTQLRQIATLLGAPLITGKTPNHDRTVLYERFRQGAVNVLVVSRVANMAVDLPDASVAIQVSGAYGSRQEEAQRLGRLLRPKANGAPAQFYTLVTQDTVEQSNAARRQQFLVEQGYSYHIVTANGAITHATNT